MLLTGHTLQSKGTLPDIVSKGHIKSIFYKTQKWVF